MRTPVIVAAALALNLGLGTPARAQSANTLSDAEREQGWVLLFNGRDFVGWRQCNGTGMPANWVIEDQAMIGLQDHGHAIWFRNIKIREL